MIHRPTLSLILAAVALTTGAVSAQDSEPSRGGQILSQYKYNLQNALRSALSEDATEAIKACQIQAPQIAEALSHNGIRVGRTSHRLRNPDNAPPNWVKPILEAYIASPSDREPRNVSLPANRLGYAEPIMLQPLCTTCHGETISKEVATRIDKLYPEDRAVGFSVGDLRGIFWVEYPAEK